jgi:hypothetical protein
MKRVALIVGLALVLPATASADPFGPNETNAFNIATAYWNAQPTNCTSIDEQTVPQSQLGAPTTLGRATITTGAPEPCFLYVETGLPFDVLCPLMAHEVGHLLGYRHSADPASIMYPNIGPASLVPGCAVASPPIHVRPPMLSRNCYRRRGCVANHRKSA